MPATPDEQSPHLQPMTPVQGGPRGARGPAQAAASQAGQSSYLQNMTRALMSQGRASPAAQPAFGPGPASAAPRASSQPVPSFFSPTISRALMAQALMPPPGRPGPASSSSGAATGTPLFAAISPYFQNGRRAVQRAGAAAEGHLDAAAQQGASSLLERAREFKTPNPAWYQVRTRAKNAALDAVATHGPSFVRATRGFAEATGQKLQGNLEERIHPRHLVTVIRNPGDAATYFQQKLQPAAQVAKVLNNPKAELSEMARQVPANTMAAFREASELIGQLDKTTTFSFSHPSPAHAARAVMERASDALATGVGVAAVTRLAFATKGANKNTNEMRNRIVSDEKLQGKSYRLPVKWALNSFTRIANNPRRALLVAGTMSLLKAGASIEESWQLKKKDAKAYAERKAKDTHIKGAPAAMKNRQAIQKTSRKPPPGPTGRD